MSKSTAILPLDAPGFAGRAARLEVTRHVPLLLLVTLREEVRAVSLRHEEEEGDGGRLHGGLEGREAGIADGAGRQPRAGVGVVRVVDGQLRAREVPAPL